MASCSVNDDCSKGYCCEAASPQNCSLLTDCYNGDGRRDILAACSKNSECATRCCSDFWNTCVGSLNVENDCKSEGLPGWAIAVIVIVVIGVIGGVIGCILCCVCASRRRSRREKAVAPKQTVTIVQAGAPGATAYPVQGQPGTYGNQPNTVVIQQPPQFYPAQGQPTQYPPQPVVALQ